MNAAKLDQSVLAGGYCIGCGACASGQGSPFELGYDDYGRLQARLVRPDDTATPFEDICPFGAGALDEDALAEQFLPEAGLRHSATGRYTSCRIGHVADELLRASGSSGGLGRWLCAELLQSDEVDAVVHVAPNPAATSSEELFSYSVSREAEEVLSTARSAYYPVSLDQVLAHIRTEPGRYAVTGVPCYVKALRQLSLHDPMLRERIAVTIGIICGHMKSTAFAEALAWQVGVPPAELRGIDFRGKLAGKPANHKGVSARSAGSQRWSEMASSKKLLGGNWGVGLFKYKACDYCDDVTAETADVSVGDAWLPEYVGDSRGSSVIVSRNPMIDRLLSQAAAAGVLVLRDSDPEEIARSQAGGLRHRREGLAHRLAKLDAHATWHPPKRTSAAEPGAVPAKRRRIYDLREKLADASHEAFSAAKRTGDFETFRAAMQGSIAEYERALSPWYKRAFKRLTARVKAAS